MPKSDTQKHILPFNEFMEELRHRGFIIGVDHHLRVQKLLNSLGTDCSPSDMKYLLCPMFATDRKQQAEFYRIFGRYFKPLERTVGTESSTPSASPTDISEPVKISKIPYIILGVLLFVLSALLYLQPEIEFNPPPVTTTLSLPATTTTLANVPVTSTTLPEITTITLPAPLPEFKPDDWNWETFRWLVISGILILSVMTELYLYSRRRAVLQKQGVKRPPFVWTIETPESNFLKTGHFYAAAKMLRRRLKGEGTRLDVKKTVTESLKAGYPKLKYKAVTRPPEYLFLIDLTSYRDHYAHFFAHIADALAKENVFVTRYFYRENPRVCFQEPGGEQFYLSDLKWKFRDCRLILVGTGDDLLDPFTGELGTWTRLFSAWQDRAILTPERPKYWGMREVMLSEKFIVLPATLTGLTVLPDYFEDPSKLSLRLWKEADARIGDNFPNPPDNLNELRAYLGNEVFQWLCACAVYPELQWNLTLYLAQVCEMPERLPDEENLLRLIRLPWFRKGNMPDDLRWNLMQELGETGIETVRERIAELFEKNPPHQDSFAYHAFRLNLAVQQFVFSPKKRKKVRKTLEGVSESHIAQDYTLLRFLESAPKSGTALVLPERIRKVFYKNGVFLFGLKSGVRLMFAAFFTVILAFLIPEPPEPRITNNINMTFVYIPPGEFMMGSPEDEPGRYDDEKQHKVTLTKGFYMQTTEVTQGQWKAVMGDNPSSFKDCGDDCPVENVSWDDVQEFINKLNLDSARFSVGERSRTYRLPTEAEWEYAARAGTATAYFWGDKADCSRMMYENDPGSSEDKCVEYIRKKGLTPDSTAPVMSYKANSWGLYDMHGNVWEWCHDWYGDYASGSVTDPIGPNSGSNRVRRGGSWDDNARACRSAYRNGDSPGLRLSGLGFRLVLPPGQQG